MHWEFPFFPTTSGRLLSYREVTSDLCISSALTSAFPLHCQIFQSFLCIFGVTFDTSDTTPSSWTLLSCIFLLLPWWWFFDVYLLLFLCWHFQWGIPRGLLLLFVHSTWMISFPALVFNDHLYLDASCILSSITSPLWSPDLGTQQPAEWSPWASRVICFICLDYSYFHRAN